MIVYALVISLQAMQTLPIRFYTAPGFFVLLIGCALLILGVVLLLTAVRQGGGLRWLAPDSLLRIAGSRPARQTTIVFVYLFLYMWLFWGEVPLLGLPVPFWLGTFLFLFAMLITFTQRRWYSIVAISAVAALLIDASFRHLAGVPLP